MIKKTWGEEHGVKTPSRGDRAGITVAIRSTMKTLRKTKKYSSQTEVKKLTLGDLILTTYSARGKQEAPKILQLAFGTQLVRFKRPLFLG